jgi:hypothetical protein
LIVGNEQRKLKLGKGSFFVKTQLKQLEQTSDTWEADFLPYPGDKAAWIGLVISQFEDSVLATLLTQELPTVNDLADLLAQATRHPLVEFSHRPKIIHLRANSSWEELLPHLKQVRTEVVICDQLPKWETAFKELSNRLVAKKGTSRRDGKQMAIILAVIEMAGSIRPH